MSIVTAAFEIFQSQCLNKIKIDFYTIQNVFIKCDVFIFVFVFVVLIILETNIIPLK